MTTIILFAMLWFACICLILLIIISFRTVNPSTPTKRIYTFKWKKISCVCRYCGKHFTAKRESHYCSSHCWYAFRKLDHQTVVPAKRIVKQPTLPQLMVPYKCKVCWKVIMSVGHRVACSEECRYKLRRALSRRYYQKLTNKVQQPLQNILQELK